MTSTHNDLHTQHVTTPSTVGDDAARGLHVYLSADVRRLSQEFVSHTDHELLHFDG
jgi:hypothetical protein